MDDYIIDTNVLLVASSRHPDSPFKDSDIPAKHQQKVFEWLIAFRDNRESKVVLDLSFKIWDEYHHKMKRGQDIGSLVIAEKLTLDLARIIDIAYDDQGHACLSPELEKVVHDRPDRKFVAVALTDMSQGSQSSIVNASDGDWYDWAEALDAAGVVVEQLIDNWCRAKWKEKKRRKRV